MKRLAAPTVLSKTVLAPECWVGLAVDKPPVGEKLIVLGEEDAVVTAGVPLGDSELEFLASQYSARPANSDANVAFLGCSHKTQS